MRSKSGRERQIRGRMFLLLSLLLALPLLPLSAQAQTDGSVDDLFGDEALDDDLFGAEDDGGMPSGEGSARTAPEADSAASEGNLSQEAPPAATGAPSSDVEEIVVQGQAGTGLADDATISVTSFDDADLEALGATDVADVARFTPNLEIVTASSTTPTFFIRGIGLNDFTANASGAIAIYQDDVPLSLPAIQLGQFFDVEEVEILKGPQGSGPFRNASGGAIRTYARKPSGELGGSFKGSYGRFQEREIEGALEVPILRDQLSARFSFVTLQRDPITQNRCAGAPKSDIDRITVFNPRNGRPVRQQPDLTCGAPVLQAAPLGKIIPNPFGTQPRNIVVSGLPAGLDDEVNDVNRWAARAQLRWVPENVDMEWNLNVHGGRIDQSAALGQTIGTRGFFGGETPNGYVAREIDKEEARILRKGKFKQKPGETPATAATRVLGQRLARRLDQKPFTGDYNRTGRERLEAFGGSLRGDVEFGWGRATSITGMERYERSRNLDADYTPDIIFEFMIEDRAWQFSQEFRVEGELEDAPLRWSAGVLYLMDQLDYENDVLAQAPRESLLQVYDQSTWSVGPFAGIEWDFLDDFTFEGGFRFNWERKEFDVALDRGPRSDVCANTGVVCHDQQTWQDPTGTLKLTYHFDEEIKSYISYNRGFKAGQFSVGGSSGVTFTAADPETVDSFELGFVGTFLDGRLDVKAAVFHYTYENYQVFLAQNDAFTPPQRVVVNADDAILYGAELETVLTPFPDIHYLDSLQFTSRLGWLESEFLDFTQQLSRPQGLSDQGAAILEFDIDWTGNRLPNTPRFKWSGTVEYLIDFGRYGTLVPRYDVAWTDDIFFDASDGRGLPDAEGRPVLPEYAIGQKAYMLHNLRLTWSSATGGIELALWVRNLTNKVYKTLAFDASEASRVVGNQVGDPQTYGLTLGLEF